MATHAGFAKRWPKRSGGTVAFLIAFLVIAGGCAREDPTKVVYDFYQALKTEDYDRACSFCTQRFVEQDFAPENYTDRLVHFGGCGSGVTVIEAPEEIQSTFMDNRDWYRFRVKEGKAYVWVEHEGVRISPTAVLVKARGRWKIDEYGWY